MSPAVTEISLTQEQAHICQIFTRAHIITADDPPDPAGEEEGPTPLEFLLAAYGSSAAIALKRAASRLGIEVEEVQVSVKWPATHRSLLDGGGAAAGEPVRREIRARVLRDITGTERDQLLDAVKKCPVDRTLAGGPTVEDALYILGYADPEQAVGRD